MSREEFFSVGNRTVGIQVGNVAWFLGKVHIGRWGRSHPSVLDMLLVVSSKRAALPTLFA